MFIFVKNHKLMRKLFYFVFFVICSFHLIAQNIPQENLQLWLRADSVKLVGEKVEQWYDLSPNHYSIVQTNANNRPQKLEDAINGKPTVKFDGVNDYLDGGDILDYDEDSHTIFLIGKTNQSKGYFFAKALYGAADSRYGLSYKSSKNSYSYLYVDNIDRTVVASEASNTIGKYVLITLQNDRVLNRNSILFNNEENFHTINGGYNFNSDFNFLIGAYNNNTGGVPPASNLFLKGEIAEIIIYNKVLSEEERNAVLDYIDNKYVPVLNLGSDIEIDYGVCDTVLSVEPVFHEVLWSTGEATHSISVNESGTYSVQAKDMLGRLQYDTIVVNYPFNKLDDGFVCIGDSSLLSLNSGLDYSYLWSTGETTSEVYVKNEGNYWVSVTDTLGCSYQSDTITLSVDNYPLTAGFGASDTLLCSGNNLTLVNGADETVDYLWNDGTTNDGFLLENSGVYHVTVTNTNGCVARDTINVNLVGAAPIPHFVSSGVCAKNAVSFIDQSTCSDGNINAWQWIYNDSVFASGTESSFIFDEAGQYEVTLRVSTDVGCHNTLTQSFDIHPLPQPNFSPDNACSGQEVLFQNLSTISSDNIESLQWYFYEGDTPHTTTGDISNVYSEIGEYKVSLIAISDLGCVDSVSKIIVVKPVPTAQFTNSSACEGEIVSFWNQSSDGENVLMENHWLFGDGESSNDSDPEHIYTVSGEYEVQLVVKSLNGCTDTLVKSVNVSDFPTVSIADLNACVGAPVTLNSESSVVVGDIVQWEWTVDGLSFNEENPTLTLEDTRTLPVHLKVWSDGGCSSYDESVLHVWENPTAQFNLPQDWGAAPLNLEIENLSEGAVEYFWNFGDGETDVLENPTHTWADSGNYVILLKAISEKGCVDSTQSLLRVIVPHIDVAIIDVRTTLDENNYLLVEADIVNAGTVPIENLTLDLNIGKGRVSREIMPEEFMQGAVKTYVFTNKPYMPNGELPEFICVNLNAEQFDETPENNQICKSNVSDFKVLDIYPNPVKDILNIQALMPVEGDLQVEVFNNEGQIIYQTKRSVEKGYQSLKLDCSGLAYGSYQLRFIFNDKVVQEKFVKMP